MAALLNTISSIRLSSTNSDRLGSQSVLTPASVSFTSKLTERVSQNIIRFHYCKCNSDNIFCRFQGGDSRLSLRKLIQMKVVCFCGFIYTCLNFQATMHLNVKSKNVFFGMVLYLYTGKCLAVNSQAPDKAPAASNGSSFNQLLGIKGASQETVSHQFSTLYHF